MELNELISKQDCISKYKEVSNYLGSRLKEVLVDIEQFYYSAFWEQRFKKRLKKEHMKYLPIELDRVLGATTAIKDDNVFKLFDKDANQKGISNTDTMIALNINMSKDQLNDSHVKNVIMHEFGHRQYNQNEFTIVIYLNSKILHNLRPKGLLGKDYEYFTDRNEIRQRIIPIVKEMYDNHWTSLEAYNNSENLKQDDLYDLYDKDTIIYWLDNML